MDLVASIMLATSPIWVLLAGIAFIIVKNFNDLHYDNVEQYRKKLISAFHNAGFDSSLIPLEEELDDGTYEEYLKEQALKGE